MLEHFSWSDYWTTVCTATSLYYVAVGTVLYKDKITALLAGGKKNPAAAPASTTAPGSMMGHVVTDTPDEQEDAETDGDSESGPAVSPEPQESENVRILDKTGHVGDRINERLSTLGPEAGTADVVQALSALMADNNADGSLNPFREVLDWHIVQTALDSCGVSLDRDDLDAIWQTEAPAI